MSNSIILEWTAIQRNEFLSIAKDAGQESDLLLKEGACITYYRIGTMPEARRILSQASPEERKKRSETFLDGLEYRSRIPQGMHDRGEAYVFADHPMEAKRDHVGHRNHLPIYIRTWSVVEKTVRTGEIWDVTLSPEEFAVDEREEMYNIVNVGRLILEENASVVVRGNAFVFTCQEVVKEGSSNSRYDIGILGTPHGFGMRRGTFDGGDGRNGMPGKNGDDGLEPMLGMSFLGKVLPHSFDPATLCGCDGEDGEDGLNGEEGLNGGACRIAEINLRSIVAETPVVVGVIPGNGGNGGNGGDGGYGGHGGNGVDEIRLSGHSSVGPGKGGCRGKGGRGGRGGKAGHSGISSNVFVSVPELQIPLLRCYSLTGKPGIPGRGGLAGKDGLMGKDGLALNNSSLDGDKLHNNANFVNPSRNGREGICMPPAKIYINGELQKVDKESEKQNSLT